MLLYVKGYRLRLPRYLILAGLFVSLTLLFRRHFTYSGVALFAAMAIQLLFDVVSGLRHQPRQAFQELYRRTGQFGLVVASTIVTLTVLGTPFIYYLLTFDYSTKFNEAERMSTVDTVWYFGTRYGWTAWVAAGTGYIVGIWTGTVSVRIASIVAISGGLSALLWVIHARAPAAHHGLNFVLFIIVGLVALLWTAYLKPHGPLCILVLGIVSVYVVANIVTAMGFGARVSETPLNGVLAAEYKPLVRDDYDEVAHIVDYLRSVASRDQRIYVTAASAAINAHTLASAEDKLYGADRFLQL